MTRRLRVLLSEASSLTAREFVTVLGPQHVHIEALTAARHPLAQYSRWTRAVHHAPAPSADPVGYLRQAREVMLAGHFDALLPTHEQAWLFAAGRHLLADLPVPVSDLASFDAVMSKIAFAQTLDRLSLPQPPWRTVTTADDLGALGFPVWVKAAFSTAGRGVRLAHDIEEARATWRDLAHDGRPVMIQQPAPGTYAQVQGVFDHGNLIAVAASEQLLLGAGGSAAARLSVRHRRAVDALTAVGDDLGWHGGLTLDYYHQGGDPHIIECNPRTVEPGNAAAAGVDLPRALISLVVPEVNPGHREARPGVRTRSTLAVALGSAETHGTRGALLADVLRAATSRPPVQGSHEVLTPVLRDPPSAVPLAIAGATLLIDPGRVSRLAGSTIADYAVTPEAVDQLRTAP